VALVHGRLWLDGYRAIDVIGPLFLLDTLLAAGYAAGAPSDPYESGETTYSLVVVSTEDRSTQSVAQWRALPGRDAQVTGSTDLRPAQIAEVQLRDADGTVLLEGSPSR
jgi:hypothetical protein